MADNKPKVSRKHAFIAGRFTIILFVCVLLACIISGYLFTTTIVHAKDWNKMATASLSDSAVLHPRRGDILASDGSILATNLRFFDVRLDLRAENFDIIAFDSLMPELSDTLAFYFPHRNSQEWQDYLRRAVSVKLSERSRGYPIVKKVPEDVANKVKKFPFFNTHRGNANYTGLVISPVTVRAYPFGDMARLSIGRVGVVNKKDRSRGLYGLEYAVDSLLYGQPGMMRRTLGTRGSYMAVTEPPVDGYHVTTTIDITIQDILETELGQMVLQSGADWGCAIIMEVKTGEIKAMSNIERDSTNRSDVYIPAMNRVVQRFEPGSVMKLMSMTVAMHYGYANPNRVYPIGHSYSYLGRPITDTHSPASLPVSRFIEYSSNIGMVKMSMPEYEHNTSLFHERLAELGFFDRFNSGIAYEKPPYFPALTNDKGGKLNLSRMIFGYTTQISPLYTCAFYNAIANDGKFVRPHLVKSLRDAAGRDSIIPISYVRDRIVTPAQAAQLRAMLHEVVWGEGGTAKCLKDRKVEIAGKTGTAKLLNIDKNTFFDSSGHRVRIPRGTRAVYLSGPVRVAFCGFFPYDNPKYTCMVVLSDTKAPRGPAASAGMVLKNTALKMYARGMLTPDSTFIVNPDHTQTPLLQASFNEQRAQDLGRLFAGSTVRRMPVPDASEQGRVPNVRGVCLRDALVRLESAGYSVNFEGDGYVYSQSPAPDTEAPYGTLVSLQLRNGR